MLALAFFDYLLPDWELYLALRFSYHYPST